MTEPGDTGATRPAKLPAQRRPAKPLPKVTDAEREQVIQRLLKHTGTGDLTLEDFSERAEMVWASATSMELEAVVSDLPDLTVAVTPAVPVVGETRRRKVRKWVVAIMSGSNRQGRWRVGESLNAICIMGGAEIDLREAEFDVPELHIVAVAIMGGVSIIVPEGIDVDLGGIAIMGGKDAKLAPVPLLPGAPRIRVTALCLMGGVDVKSKRPASEIAAARAAKREAEREKRELRRLERAERERDRAARRLGIDADALGKPPAIPRPPRPPRPRDLRRDIGRELRGVVHEQIRETINQSLELRKDALREAARDRWEVTDADAAAVRRRLKSNGRPEGTVTILFTDIEASTELTQRLGDEQASVLLKEHNELIRAQVVAHGGFEVKFRGDGFMLAFGSAAKGVRCAIAIQQEMKAFANRCDEPFLVRVGINSGEAVPDGNDFLGTAVNIAARLTDAAEGGEVLVTSVVRDLVSSTGEFKFSDERMLALKGISDPQRSCSVEW
jgi:class 3 adenylate cyclase